MKKLDIKKMEKMEYWVGNSFIENFIGLIRKLAIFTLQKSSFR